MPRRKETITVLDITGIQEVDVKYCCCERSTGVDGVDRNQLLNIRWFPASGKRPGTAVTFSTLKLYEIMSLQSKISGHDFYQSIVRLTDNEAINRVPVRNVLIDVQSS